jgi:hypothetical protein
VTFFSAIKKFPPAGQALNPKTTEKPTKAKEINLKRRDRIRSVARASLHYWQKSFRHADLFGEAPSRPSLSGGRRKTNDGEGRY